MADLEELLKSLKALGVKSASFHIEGELSAVEFFPSIPALDLDTLVPPAADDEGDVDPASSIPSAFKRILGKPSVS